jgi:hypothetical protein
MLVIPATLEAESRRIQASPREKFETPISINKPGMVAHTCDPSYSEGKGRRITSETLPENN